MTVLRALMSAAIVALCTAPSQAGTLGTDPHIRINDPVCSSPVPVGLSFTFLSNGAGGGLLCFSNASGQDWSSLNVDVAPPMPPAAISCGGSAFSTCEPGAGGNPDAVDFSGLPGIPNGAIFDVDLGLSGWTPDAPFEALANQPTPEPGTVTLLLLGLCGFGVRRRWQQLASLCAALFLQ